MGIAINEPTLYVGVGASAGGLDACGELLAAVPADTGMAFILVLHLDPTRTSHLAQILQQHASNLTIVQAEGTTRLERDHVYVIAPNSKLHLVDGMLEVDPLAEDEARGQLVDYLFSSLAEAQRTRAVGVVLSGAGHDGTEGLGRIKAAGGLTIAQAPVTAGSTGMPSSAINAGVDAVLAPDAIPAALIAFAEHGVRPLPRHAEDGNDGPGGARDQMIGFASILHQIGTMADIDFDDYKPGTLQRRALRRMNLKGIETWDDYAHYLGDNPDELDALYRDVMIGVTEFFREPAVWERLAAELPALLESRGEPGARAWVAGCATGEEAYSLAMILFEQLPEKDRGKIQIYATDINEHALAIARRGIYAAEALQGVSHERREQHFKHHDGQFKVGDCLRSCVSFAPHNVLSDPPFSRMDIVSCRNLLIYLKPQAHDRLLKSLHFALRPGGLLVLGRAETLGRQTRLFDEISKPQNIFRSRAIPQHERFRVDPRTREHSHGIRQAVPLPLVIPAHLRESAPDRRIDQFVLRQHTPACVVINADFEIRSFYGQTQPYLAPPTGESHQDLLAWMRPGFYIRLRSALKQVAESGEPLVVEGQIDRDGEIRHVQCAIEQIPPVVNAEGMLLVTFQDIGASTPRKIDPAAAHEPLVHELEMELIATRRELQSTIEQLDVAGEGYRASHEELMSLNEELQSSNEELEASKEELEALNEEMNTINRELEEKNGELRVANNDLNTLFLSTGIPTVFLDRELKVRRFTPTATTVMHLVPSDIARSIEHVKERVGDGHTADKSRQVLRTAEPDTTEVWSEGGERCYVRSILPYRSEEGTLDGVCITFSDVTEQKTVAQANEAALAYSEAIIEVVRTPLLILDRERRILSVNRALQLAYGVGPELLGSSLTQAQDQPWNVSAIDDAVAAVSSGGGEVKDLEVVVHDRTILVNVRLVHSRAGEDRILLSFEDATQQREFQRRSEQRAAEFKGDERRKDEWIAVLGHELRNPIGAISNGIELLKSTSLAPDQQTQIVGMLERQIGYIARLLDDLLDIARVISGKLDIARKPVDLIEVARWALDASMSQFSAKTHEISFTLPPARTVWVRGDQLRLHEILVNLLDNAAKYTPRGGCITLEIVADAEQATISVRDTGIGIPHDLKEHIFEIFTQGPRTLERLDRGLGIGLSLVYSLVKLHGGEVEVFSAGAGQGSEFRVRLPRIQHAGEAAQPADHGQEPLPTQRYSRVLIVDDEGDVADSLQQLLKALGHEVQVAANGSAALDRVQTFKPEIALLDLGLPGMDGYKLARRLRDELPEVVLIAITGYQADSDRLKAAGFDHHMIKPISIERLSRLLHLK